MDIRLRILRLSLRNRLSDYHQGKIGLSLVDKVPIGALVVRAFMSYRENYVL